MFYGLDWIATVPPTVKLTADRFGRERAGIVFGWIFTGHQLGAACAAFLGGVVRTTTGSYLQAFVLAGLAGLAAAVMSLFVGGPKRGRLSGVGVPAPAAG
jgi:predicted MFS family arabinose efflux permease